MKTLIASIALRAFVMGTVLSAVPAAAQKPQRAHKLAWESLADVTQKQLKLFWGLTGMIAEEKFNAAPAERQKDALREAARQSAFDLKDRVALEF